MAVPRVTPEQAKDLLAKDWVYLDVRTEMEFSGGHPPGAYNIPFAVDSASGRVPNPDFVAAVQQAFPRDTQLVLGCRSGRRSLAAAEILVERGYTKVVDMRGGMAGEIDDAGNTTCEGWEGLGLDTTRSAQPGRDYVALHAALENR